MFRTASSFAVLLCAPLWAAPVPVQAKADGAPPASAIRLLAHRCVQKELKMTAEQRIALIDALEDLDEAFEKTHRQLEQLPNPPEDALVRLRRAYVVERDKAFATTVKGLAAAQLVRLRQLDVRARGVEAFGDPAVEMALQLTASQKKKAKDARAQLTAAVKRFFEGGGNVGDTEEQREGNFFEFRAGLQKDVETNLTKEQKAIWAQLLGEKPLGVDLTDLWWQAEEEAHLWVL